MARAAPVYKPGGKFPMGVDTDPQPEGTYFKYIYTFDNIPEQFQGFKDAPYMPYLDKPLYEADNFEFE